MIYDSIIMMRLIQQKQQNNNNIMGNSQDANDATSNQVKQVYTIYSNSLISQTHLNPDAKRISKDVVRQLFQSFTRYQQYSWSEEITPLFMSYFSDNINTLWTNDKQKFYKQMLENSGLLDHIDQKKKSKNYQNLFYTCEAIKLKNQKIKEDEQFIENNIQALNYSIVDEEEPVPFVFKRKNKNDGHHSYGSTNGNRSNVNHSMGEMRGYSDYEEFPQLVHTHSSQYYDIEILRSSVIQPETIFVQRLNQQSKFKVNNMLNFYKIFSESLQQMIRSISLMACPLKHFEISLKRKVRVKKIKSMGSSPSLLRDSKTQKNQALLRKKQQYNNTFLLVEIRDFTDAYTEFMWKYLNLYRVSETEFSNFITIQTAYGVVLKLVWTFASWIGQRGYDWQQKQIPSALKKLQQQQEAHDKKSKKFQKVQINLQKQIIRLGCDLSTETNPQKYLKKIVIIYRQLSKKCTNADELILYYEAFFQQLAKENCCQRLFRMQTIIDKLLKMEDSCGQICYAWTTWNIMVQTIKKIITNDSKQKQVEEDFKKYLSRIEKSRLSG